MTVFEIYRPSDAALPDVALTASSASSPVRQAMRAKT
jgi:hypothetical protein